MLPPRDFFIKLPIALRPEINKRDEVEVYSAEVRTQLKNLDLSTFDCRVEA
jgi:hypothetical protein